MFVTAKKPKNNKKQNKTNEIFNKDDSRKQQVMSLSFKNASERERESRVGSPVVDLPSELGVLLSQTLPRCSSSPSLVGTCWEHHSLSGLTPPTLPAWRLRKDGVPSCVLAGAGCWAIGWDAAQAV